MGKKNTVVKVHKICPAGAEFFHVTRQTDRQTDRNRGKQTWQNNFMFY